jgi:hypothetical protein
VDRKIVIYGGGQGSTYYDSIYVLDTITRRWSRPTVSGPTPPPRRAHTGVLYHGKIFMFGGGNGMTALNDVWTLDVSNMAKMRWEEVPTTGRKPSHRGYHTANLIGNIMIVVGGSDGKDCFSDIWCLNLGAFGGDLPDLCSRRHQIRCDGRSCSSTPTTAASRTPPLRWARICSSSAGTTARSTAATSSSSTSVGHISYQYAFAHVCT